MFEFESFDAGEIQFTLEFPPISNQSSSKRREAFKSSVRDITRQSQYVFTEEVHIAIDWYCNHLLRWKNPSVMDIDNITKPLIDSLLGIDGVLIDDVQVNRVTTNWIDTLENEYIEVTIDCLDGLFSKKEDLILLKFNSSGFCFPCGIADSDTLCDLVKKYHETWVSINTMEDYYQKVGTLPWQRFYYYSKVKNSGFTIKEID